MTLKARMDKLQLKLSARRESAERLAEHPHLAQWAVERAQLYE